ncbi:MAG TPA: protein meaA [Acidimicrobiales bacterium]|nr:protein meaA [Acidimicrobiales bacterium]
MTATPWVMRTYSGHSSAAASNALYRANLARGQTGLSVAFDLPTQTGYDPDAPEAAGEVGRVGVPVAHLGDLRALFDGIPLAEMNTSMTINATAPWIWALYLTLAAEQGADWARLAGTTQNDIVKEYLSRGTYVFAPGPSKRLTVDMIAWGVEHAPAWNPINVCSYHLQEAGATPVQEVAYALATAVDVLDAVRDSGKVAPDALPRVVGRISFFLNAGVRFVEEVAKVRAFTALWDEICRTRYGVDDPALRRFRYGVQVNSLGLTEQQPENNVTRIVLEMLGVTLSADARARAVQLPAWNEALGLPREWDQQWSLRAQQVLAYETDLLEYPDLFAGSKVMESLTRDLAEAARVELDDVLSLGGAFAAIDELKARLVVSQARRLARIESGEQVVVGVNRFTETASSPLTEGTAVLVVDESSEARLIDALSAWRESRDASGVAAALAELRRVAASDDPDDNVMVPSLALASAGGTTGEWADALRGVWGDYRAPTGVRAGAAARGPAFAALVDRSRALVASRGRPPKLLIAKPGLDGHSNGAEQVAVAARDAGFEVVYPGIRLSPEQIVAIARDEDVDIVGVSILSGSHLTLVPQIVNGLRAAGVTAPVVVGGIVSAEDAASLRASGVTSIYTPKDFALATVVGDLLAAVEGRVRTLQ